MVCGDLNGKEIQKKKKKKEIYVFVELTLPHSRNEHDIIKEPYSKKNKTQKTQTQARF